MGDSSTDAPVKGTGPYGGLTHSVFGSGKSYLGSLKGAVRKGGKNKSSSKSGSSSKSSKSGSSSKSGGSGSKEKKGKKKSKHNGGGKRRKKKKKRSADAEQEPGDASPRSGAASPSPGDSDDASDSDGSDAGAASASGAGGAGAGAGAGAGVNASVGANSGSGVGIGAGAGAGAGGGSGSDSEANRQSQRQRTSTMQQNGSAATQGGTAPLRGLQKVDHRPQATQPGDIPDYVLEFGHSLRKELAQGVPTLEGYLIKLGGVSLGLRALKRWTRRYFELKGPILRYWETKADKENGGLSSVRGAYELDGAKVESVRVTDAPFPYAVELVTADGLREYLVAEKQTHVDLWTRALEGVITSLKAFPALHLARSKKRGTVTLPDPPSMPLAMLDGPLPDATANAQAAASPQQSSRSLVTASQPGVVGSPVHSPGYTTGPGQGAASVVSDSYLSSPSVHTIAVAVPVAVEPTPAAAASGAQSPTPAVIPSVAEEKTCVKCGNVLEPGDMFCDNCGNRVG